MAISVTHSTVVVTPDDGTSEVGSDEWNAAHTIAGTVDLANGGTGAALSDPGADRVMAWDDSAGAVKFMPVGDFNAEAAPASGDKFLAYTAEGALVAVDFDDLPGGGAGSGDVVGPAGATDNAIARFDGATGKAIQNSGVVIDDSNNITGVVALSATTIELGHASDTTLARSSAGVITIEGNTVWHSGNDGSGSGLDADLLDGKNTGTSGNVVPLLDGANTWSAQQTFALGSGNDPVVISNTADDQDANVLILEGDRATPGDGDFGYVSLKLSDDGGDQSDFARLKWAAQDVSAGNEGGEFVIEVANEGSLTSAIVIQPARVRISGVLDLGHDFDTTIERVSGGVVAIEGSTILTEGNAEAFVESAIDTLPNLTSVQGLTVTLADAGADAVFGWDDSAGAYENLTASEVLEIIKTVDGSGSGLDADLLDGQSSAFYATASSVSDHLADATDAHDASAISFVAAGNIAATDVQAAIEELDSEKQPLDADLTSIAALTTTTAGRSVLTIADPNADRVIAWDDSAGAMAAIALADITDEPSPAAGDFILIYGAEGDLRRVDWDDLPTGGSYTDEEAQDAVGGILVDTDTIDFTYTDATPSITADVKDNSITYAKMQDVSATSRVLGRITSGAGDVEELTGANVKTIVGSGDLTKVDDTNVTLTLGGTPTAALFSAVSITAGWTGQLSLARGGTGTSLSDPNADRLMAWDDSASAVKFFALTDFTDEASPASGDYVLIYGAEGDLRRANWSTLPGAGGGISNVSEDTSPTLGGDLEDGGFDLITTGSFGIERDDASTDTVLSIFNLQRTSSGTPDAGIGVEMALNVETAVGNIETGAAIRTICWGTESGNEEFQFVFRAMTQGALHDMFYVANWSGAFGRVSFDFPHTNIGFDLSTNGASNWFIGCDQTLGGTGADFSIANGSLSFVKSLLIEGDTNKVCIGGGIIPPRQLTVFSDPSDTNIVTPLLQLRQGSSGTPATGIGTSIEFAVETSSDNFETGATIEAVTTNVGSGTEGFDLVVKTMAAGATAAERLRVSSAGTSVKGVRLANISNVTASGSTGVTNTETNLLETSITLEAAGRVHIRAWCDIQKDTGTTARAAELRLRRDTNATITSADVLVESCAVNMGGLASVTTSAYIEVVESLAAGTYFYAILGQNGNFAINYRRKWLTVETLPS